MQKKVIRGTLLVFAASLFFFFTLPHMKYILIICTSGGFSWSKKTLRTIPSTMRGPTVFVQPKAEVYDEKWQTLKQYENRKTRIESVCEGRKELKATDKRLDHLLVDEKHKVVLCDIPKVGSTNWRRVFLLFAGFNQSLAKTAFFRDVNDKYSSKYLRFLDSFKRDERATIMRDYYKFMFVRNPLDRLLSAYKDRFVLTHSRAYKEIGPKIIRMFRPRDIMYYRRRHSRGVKFDEFLRYLLTIKDLNQFNMHWIPYHTYCQPCGVAYDFIGKYETMAQDVRYVLDEMGESNISFPTTSHFKTDKTAGKFKTKQQYFSSISSKLLDKIFQLYKRDYDLFGYTRTVPL